MPASTAGAPVPLRDGAEAQHETMPRRGHDLVEQQVVCEILTPDRGRILLKTATRGISNGKVLGPGGKCDLDEPPHAAAVREAKEETGLDVKELFYHGSIMCLVGARMVRVHYFSTTDYSGTLVPNHEEGSAEWVPVGRIRLEAMWPADRYILPMIIRGERFDGRFAYDTAGRLLSHEISAVRASRLRSAG